MSEELALQEAFLQGCTVHDHEGTRLAQRLEAAEAQDQGALPLVGDLHRRGDDERQDRGDKQHFAFRPQVQEDRQSIGGSKYHGRLPHLGQPQENPQHQGRAQG